MVNLQEVLTTFFFKVFGEKKYPSSFHNPTNQNGDIMVCYFNPKSQIPSEKSPTFQTPSKSFRPAKSRISHGWVSFTRKRHAEVKEAKTLSLCVACVVGQPRSLWGVQNFEMPNGHTTRTLSTWIQRDARRSTEIRRYSVVLNFGWEFHTWHLMCLCEFNL